MLTKSGQEFRFEAEPIGGLVGMIKARQVEPYGTLDKFVSCLVLIVRAKISLSEDE